MKNLQQGFVASMLLIIISLVLVGGVVYVYKQKVNKTDLVVNNLPADIEVNSVDKNLVEDIDKINAKYSHA